MADNVSIAVVGPSVASISTEEVTNLNGTTVAAQQVQRILAALRTADGIAVDVPGDGTFGLDVDVTRLPAIALDSATLAALENLTVTVSNPGSGQATETTLAAVLSGLGGLASQTTAAAILAKLSADPASQTTLAAVLAAVDGLEANTTGLATATAQASAQSTLASILAAVDTLELLATGPDTVYRGTAAATIDLAASERLHSVLVVPTDGGQVTVTVPGQAADQAPVDFPYAEDFKGGLTGPSDVVIAGAVAYYRVTTFTP